MLGFWLWKIKRFDFQTLKSLIGKFLFECGEEIAIEIRFLLLFLLFWRNLCFAFQWICLYTVFLFHCIICYSFFCVSVIVCSFWSVNNWVFECIFSTRCKVHWFGFEEIILFKVENILEWFWLLFCLVWGLKKSHT
jgi:hypothetical protein